MSDTATEVESTDVSVEVDTPAQTGADWVAELNDDDRGLIEVKGWDTPSKALEGYRSLEKAYGDPNKVVIPGENATPEELDKFHKALGKPDSADDYQFESPEGFAGYSQDLADGFRKFAHEKGLSADLARDLHDWFVSGRMAEFKSYEDAHAARFNEQDAAVRKEFGADFDNKMKLANRAYKEFGGDELTDLLVQQSIDNHPLMVSTFAKIGGLISEHDASGTGAGSAGLSGALTPEAAISQKQSDPTFMKALTSREDPGHDNAVKVWDQLHMELGQKLTDEEAAA